MQSKEFQDLLGHHSVAIMQDLELIGAGTGEQTE
jgi:hypothetical protein